MKKIFILFAKIVGAGIILWFLLLFIISIRDGKVFSKGIFNNSITRHILKERDEAQRLVGLMAVNSFKPESFKMLVDFALGKTERFSGTYLDYYQRVAEYYSYVVGGHETMGFCYYHAGIKDKALEAYQEAVDIHPDFFWAYYNLGLLYFEKGDYQQAEEIFQKASQIDPKKSLQMMYQSRVYLEILREAKDLGYTGEKGLKEAYLWSHKLRRMSQQFKESPLEDPIDFLNKNRIYVRLF